jgi:hypothetical protein
VLDKLKRPFWFGLPLYAWLAGGAALVLGVGYFAFFARSQAAATAQTDGSVDPTLNPYPSTDPGAGSAVPPSPAFSPSGEVIYTQPSPAYLTPSPPIYTPTSTAVATAGPRIITSAPTTYSTPAASGVATVGGYIQRSINNLIAALPTISQPAPAPLARGTRIV